MMVISKEKIMVVEDWLKRAERDYKVALLLGSDEEGGFFEDACFHCQQAVEKFLKALIIYCGGRFKRVHALKPLCESINSLGISVDGVLLEEDIKMLDGFYTGCRYPGAAIPRYEEALEAIKIVEKVKRFVENDAGLGGIEFDKSWWESA